jgi:hypothetical protein
MAKLSTKHSQPHWYKIVPAIALLAAAAVAGFTAADSGPTTGARSAVDSAAGERVTVIHKDPQGLWPKGNVWVGRTNCNDGGSVIFAATQCAAVINSTIGIDV